MDSKELLTKLEEIKKEIYLANEIPVSEDQSLDDITNKEEWETALNSLSIYK